MEPANSPRNIEPRSFSDFYKAAQLVSVPTDGATFFINFRPSRESSKCRIYFASFLSANGNINVFYADVDMTDNAGFQNNLILQPLLPKDAFRSFTVHPKVSLAESLLRERMRIGCFSASDVKFDPQSGVFLICLSGKIIRFTDYNWPSSSPYIECTLNVLSAPEGAIQPICCPCNPNLIAYVNGSNIGIANAFTSTYLPLTSITNPKISAGKPSYIIQEEFDRYIGLWWRPILDSSDTYCLVYEETDESDVGVVTWPSFAACNGQVEEHAYPKPGKKNATSTLKMVSFVLDSNSGEVSNVKTHELVAPLFQLLPDYEYVVRCGWTENGEYFWMILSNRLQSKMTLFLVSPQSFTSNQSIPFIHLNDEENSVYWVIAHDCLRFLSSDPSTVHYVWLSQRTGYSHLYEHIQKIPPTSQSSLLKSIESAPSVRHSEFVKQRQLTSGPWEVLRDHVFVDEANRLILFEALREHPLYANVYAVNYGLPEPCIYRLTLEADWLPSLASNTTEQSDYQLSYSILSYEAASGLCVLEASSPTLMPGQVVFKLHVDSSGVPRLRAVAELKKLVPIHSVLPTTLNELHGPQILSFTFRNIATSRTDLTFYGMLFTPALDTRPQRGFPTLHLVYGGPGVQLVRGVSFRNLIQKAQIYCHYGYALLLCDCRGSANRGIQFAGHIKYQMGTVELPDHVMFLREAANQTKLIDLNRVAIYGSSYGGYLALMAAAKHRDVYRASIAVCPVVSWHNYDTAYTERYLGIPEEHEGAYINGDIMSYVNYFPDQSPYLLIAHGGQDENVHFSHTASLMQRLNALGKPYNFSFYPESRHRIREDDHLMATILKFLDQTLQMLS